MFDNVREALKRDRRGRIDYALGEVKKAIELVVHEFEIAQTRASEHGLLPGDEELDPSLFLDAKTFVLLYDLENLYDRLDDRLVRYVAAPPFENDSSK